MSQIIIYDDMSFYQCADGYYCNGKTQRLHRYKWEKEVGPIPTGYHIHHKNGDKNNNDLENLDLLSAHEHLSMHSSENMTPDRIKFFNEKVKPLATEWHNSQKAVEFGKQNWTNSLGIYMDKKTILKCQCCGKEYERTVFASWGAKYCGNNCKSQARRNSGIDNEIRQCEVCGKDMIVNKYDKTCVHSGDCQVKMNLYKRTGVMWGDGVDQRVEIKKLRAKKLFPQKIDLSKLDYYKKCQVCGHEWKSNIINQRKCPNCRTAEWDGGNEWLKLKLSDMLE